MKVGIIVYHKDAEKLYPKEWIDMFRYSILNQTYNNFDIFEVNYGGGGYRIFPTAKFTSIEYSTFSHAMNFLLVYCFNLGYDVVANTNCDDYYTVDRIEKQVEAIKRGADIVSSNFSLVVGDDITLTHEFGSLNIKEELAKDHNIVCHPSVCYSKNYISNVNNRYIPEEIPFEDMKLWQRTIDKYKFIILDDVLCFHRLHDTSVGHKGKE